MKLAIIRERKNPPDRRVVFSPDACIVLLKEFPNLEIKIESSNVRVFTDDDYKKKGLHVTNDVSDCDVMLGVKEVPIDALIPNKKYFFFSHTIKKQPYNRDLLRAILSKNIELYDHEVITNKKGNRTVAFGRYAGIVGAYNGFRTYGLKYNLFDLPKAESLKSQVELIEKLNLIKVKLPNIKIVLTGKGRVSNGAKEMLEGMQLREVDSNTFLNKNFNESVFVQIDVLDYNKRKDGKKMDKYDFYNNPKDYVSNFMQFAKVANYYISGHFFGSGSPFLFTREDLKATDFNIKVVADVSCDIDGPVACTIRSSTIADPIYGYDVFTEREVDFKSTTAIAVMAVDNLPCELPRDASIGFGKMFAKYVIPAFFNKDKDGFLKRAQITKNGKLTKEFLYLQDYVKK
ncbi:MAG: NAD(P)-dependent oxidoreductase [Flavobacteriaceae bacterium]|nr:NAD(P)-dependent oxidoreductase [Flavobacteriaceae bacterium]